ncbi:MAG: sensor histidine kinase [Anaerolineae bacterium]|nr:sensor histidine kinase [Anaerolineae bacterium]
MKNDSLEPEVLRIYRFFLVVQLIIITVNVLVHSRRSLLFNYPAFTIGFSIFHTALWLIYLAWPFLQKWLKWAYLPIALFFTTLFSVIAQDIFLSVHITAGNLSSEEAAWQLFLFLFVPLILIAWQYDFKAVVLYCIFTTLLDHALMVMTQPAFSGIAATYHRLLFIRALSFLIAGYIIARIMKQFRQQHAALQQANRDLVHYASTLEQLTISRERNRMARELHDTLAHTLSGISIQLEAALSLAEPISDEMHSLLSKSLTMTRSGLNETRRALQDLRSEPLEDLGLEKALQHLAEENAQRAGLKLNWSCPTPLPELAPDVVQSIYRIAQEAFENIVRHAGARQVNVQLNRQSAGVTLSIEDDGRGFDPNSFNDHSRLGLRGMRERAEMIGANLSITSQAGQGCRILLSIQGKA